MSCSVCSTKFSTPIDKKEFLTHMRTHRHTKNAHFVCFMSNCQELYTNFTSLQSHLKRKHALETTRDEIRDVSNAGKLDVNNQCNISLCGKLCKSLADTIQHLKGHIREGTSFAHFLIAMQHTR